MMHLSRFADGGCETELLALAQSLVSLPDPECIADKGKLGLDHLVPLLF